MVNERTKNLKHLPTVASPQSTVAGPSYKTLQDTYRAFCMHSNRRINIPQLYRVVIQEQNCFYILTDWEIPRTNMGEIPTIRHSLPMLTVRYLVFASFYCLIVNVSLLLLWSRNGGRFHVELPWNGIFNYIFSIDSIGKGGIVLQVIVCTTF